MSYSNPSGSLRATQVLWTSVSSTTTNVPHVQQFCCSVCRAPVALDEMGLGKDGSVNHYGCMLLVGTSLETLMRGGSR